MSETMGPRQMDVAAEPKSNGFALVLYGMVFAYIIFYVIFRDYGAVGIATISLVTVTIHVLFARHHTQMGLLVFLAVTVAYFIASYTGVMHQNITAFFNPSAIPQQAAHGVLLASLVPAMAYYHEQVETGRRDFVLFNRGLMVVIALATVFFYFRGGATGRQTLVLGNLTNLECVTYFLLFKYLIFRKWQRPVWLVGFAGAMVWLASTSQAQLIVFAALVARIVDRLKTYLFLAVLVGGPVGVVAALSFPSELFQYDSNAGVRAWIWIEVIQRVIETNWMGVGFGTETVPLTFADEYRNFRIFQVTRDSFIHIGAHNAFLDTLYRMGIIGFGVIVAYFGSKAFRFISFRRHLTGFDFTVFIILLVSMYVNVALVGMYFIFGSAFLLGWVAYRERQIRLSLRSATKAPPAGHT